MANVSGVYLQGGCTFCDEVIGVLNAMARAIFTFALFNLTNARVSADG
jgi:hypothetical protein